MQTVSKKTILPFVDLTCITTDKFKTGFVSVNFITPLSSKTAAKNSLLPRVLRRGTVSLPDMESISGRLDELYGARIIPVVRKIGEAHCIGMCADFIDEDFLPKGERVQEKIFSLLSDMLLSPVTRSGLLLSEYVESEKAQLTDEIKSIKNDKISYSINRLIESMCANEAYGVSKYGTQAAVAAITPRALTNHYKEVISSSAIKVIYCGSSDIDTVSRIFTDAFSNLPRRSNIQPVETDVVLAPKHEKPAVVIDEADVAQGKLTLGFRLGKSMVSPNYPALMVFNEIFGGDVCSKLFQNVREKMSLCYYANSMLEKIKGLMLVFSGVEFSNFQVAYDEILRQLDAVKNGEITADELNNARRSVSTYLRTKLDSPSSIESLYFDSAVSGLMLSPEEMAAMAETVAVEEVIKIASEIKLDTVHCLTAKGGAGIEA